MKNCVFTLLLLFVFSQASKAQTVPSDVIINGDFEAGEEFQAPPWSLIGCFAANSSELARTGQRFLLMGGDDGKRETASQKITIPNTPNKVFLTFYLEISSSEIAAVSDIFSVRINRSSNQSDLIEVYSDSDEKEFSSYKKQSFDLSQYKGETVILNFNSSVDNSFRTFFSVDDVSISIPDFALQLDGAPSVIKKGSEALIAIKVLRVSNFEDQVTITPPDKITLKELGIKITPPSDSTTKDKILFTMKVKKNAGLGTKTLIFTGKDSEGRIRTIEVTIRIVEV